MTEDSPGEATLGTWEELECIVNGVPVSRAVPADLRLASFLRRQLGLTATKVACEVGVCGVCTVLLDGKPISSCITLAVQVHGREVLTLEGIAARADMESLLQAFVTEGGFQCGFCTSGQIVTAASLRIAGVHDRWTAEQRREYMQGNLCRCTGYYGIERALDRAFE